MPQRNPGWLIPRLPTPVTLLRDPGHHGRLYHEPPHSLLLDSFVLLLLFPLGVGVVRGHRLCELLDFACDRPVIFLEILGMLKNAVEVFLQSAKRRAD